MTNNLNELADRCEKATADEQHELLQQAGTFVLERGTEAWTAFNRAMHGFCYLDAAMTLVPEGWRRLLSERDDGSWVVSLLRHDAKEREQGDAATPALALCAAALRSTPVKSGEDN